MTEHQNETRIEAGQLEEVADVAKILTANMTLGRQHMVYSQLSEIVKPDGQDGLTLLVCREKEAICGGAIAIKIAQDSALLVGVGSQEATTSNAGCLSRALADRLHACLAEQGFQFIQATWETDDSHPPFAPFGYQWIASLDYMAVDLLGPSSFASSATENIDWESRGMTCRALDPTENQTTLDQFIGLIDKTYEETKDCPRLNDFRTADQVVNAYITAPAFDSTGWRLLYVAEEPAGCLVTTSHPQASALELNYMGVAPKFRGRGMGSLLISETLQIAKGLSSRQVMLAVDRDNAPAATLYRQHGFTKVTDEAIWGLRL